MTGPNDVRAHGLGAPAPATDATLEAELDALDALYIADGHHRSAAAARVAAQRRGSPDASHEFFLAVAFPHDEMRILDYNRVVRDLNGLIAGRAARAHPRVVRRRRRCRPASRRAQPETFGMYLGGRWYELDDHAGARAARTIPSRASTSACCKTICSRRS